MLICARDSRGLWLAAIVATVAVACKHNAVGIPLAQIVWLGLSSGRAAALRHAVRCAVAAAVMAALAVAAFGGAGLWFVMFELPSHLPWDSHPMTRLLAVAPKFALQAGVPAVVMIFGRR